MNNFYDFSNQGYKVIRELGRNCTGGRVVYLAQTDKGDDVVIKQFQFAKGDNWDGFDVIEREIKILKDLRHPGIPRYLDEFKTSDGFCLVQEYKQGRMLSETRSFAPAEVKRIAIQLLEILVYLQERVPPVIHRDIKPENVLVDDSLNVYLIDFGFARLGIGTVAISSGNAGTFGFMAPEQILNLKLTNSSDLYGLGLTLICVIGGIPSNDIGYYMDYNYKLDRTKIDAKLTGCSLRFIDWAQKMTAPNPNERYSDAQTALEALRPLDVKRSPSVECNPKSLEFKAEKWGQILSQTFVLTNATPETILEGQWEIASHPNDSLYNKCNWIVISPDKILSNHVNCKVTIDTSKLLPESKGSRQLVFYSNADVDVLVMTVHISTGELPGYIKTPIWVVTTEAFYVMSVMGLAINGGYTSWSVSLCFIAGALIGAIPGVAIQSGSAALFLTLALCQAINGFLQKNPGLLDVLSSILLTAVLAVISLGIAFVNLVSRQGFTDRGRRHRFWALGWTLLSSILIYSIKVTVFSQSINLKWDAIWIGAFAGFLVGIVGWASLTLISMDKYDQHGWKILILSEPLAVGCALDLYMGGYMTPFLSTAWALIMYGINCKVGFSARNERNFVLRVCLATAFGLSLGATAKFGFLINPFITLFTIASGIGLAKLSVIPFFQRRLLLLSYRQKERGLIQL